MTALDSATVTPLPIRLFRVQVHARPGEVDVPGHEAMRLAEASGVALAAAHGSRIFLMQGPLDEAMVREAGDALLADPINQTWTLGVSPPVPGAVGFEVHYKPGVMDPVAQSTESGLHDLLPSLRDKPVSVRTGVRYELVPADESVTAQKLQAFVSTQLANVVIQDVHSAPWTPQAFEETHDYRLHVTHVPIRDLDDAGLAKLSREGHLFLSLDEMRAIRDHYRAQDREPSDIELETLAQTWSEHCVHKTLKSTIHFTPQASDKQGDPLAIFRNKDRHEIHDDGTVTIDNLLKSTVAAATFKLMETPAMRHWCVSVFEDNAGIVRFDDQDALCIKVETHNHPSAIEPYGGAATGIGGCIRDVMGTGLVARPVANTDTFCVAMPDHDPATLPKGVIHPRHILERVVAGVRDYGNRMGIPTVNGAVYFHPDYLGNPLVFAGCVGIMPLDRCFGDAQPGDRIIAIGGATGRDGIHGATFSSAELTDTHADEFSHAVQIGNPITQKKVLDVLLQARDAEGGPLHSAITDCGAGGFSSAIGEMGAKIGARVELEKAPLKYQGLSYTEIWISEAQERMVLAVPPDKLDALVNLCEREEVAWCDLGQFGWHAKGPGEGEAQLLLTYHGQSVGTLSMDFMHEGIPTPTRRAVQQKPAPIARGTDARRLIDKAGAEPSLQEMLTALLAHPNIASKHWIIRQYDHEVQGGSVVKPLVGPMQLGPGDAAVIRPKLTSEQGVALACGLAPLLSEKAVSTGLASDGDAYQSVLAAMDEAVRNAVCVGADSERICVLDNFCWPGCEDPALLASLVLAAEACYDGALAYGTPFVSGKDSLNNQFTTEDGRVIAIPPTMLITAMGLVPDVLRSCTMDAKRAGNLLLIVGRTGPEMGGAHHRMLYDDRTRLDRIPRVNLQEGPHHARIVSRLIRDGLIASAHDCSDGGLLVAAAEMAFAGDLGLALDLTGLPVARTLDPVTACFAETPSRYLLEVAPEQLDQVARALQDAQVAFARIGQFVACDELSLRTAEKGQLLSVALDSLRTAWRSTLDW